VNVVEIIWLAKSSHSLTHWTAWLLRAVAPALHTTRSLARFQEVATGTPVLDLIWLIHEERGRPLGRFQDVGIRLFMDVSLHINLVALTI